jgi:PAS domain S-box-containing protein
MVQQGFRLLADEVSERDAVTAISSPQVAYRTKKVAERATELFEIDRQANFERVDRIFIGLMLLQWAFGIVLALVLSPYSYSGDTRSIHPHLYLAIFLGGAISALPIALAILRPGRPTTRYTIAIAQMLWSALLIHISGGRIETHFHVFGSLALIAFYRDWKTLVPATVVVVADHYFRGILMPESVYGVASPEWWRFLEHAGWVVFEDTFLTLSCVHGKKEMHAIAARQADVEALSEREQVRSAELDSALARVTGLNEDLRTELAERHRAEHEVARLTEERELILDNAADAVVGLDLLGRPTFMNPAASEMTGWTVESLQRMRIPSHELIHRVGPDRTPCSSNCTLQRACTTGEVFHGPEEWFCRRDGTLFPAEVRVAAITDRDSLRVGTVVTFHDITERREIERIKELERTRVGRLGRLAASVAHEFNNVLMGAQPFAELLLRATTTPETKNWSRQILDSIARGKRITEEILRFARPSEIEARPFCVQQWLGAMSQEISGFMGNRHFDLQLPEEPLYIEGDRLQMTQVMINLARNACDAMPDGGTLTIAALQVYSYQQFPFANLITPDQFVHFTVQDSGSGIPADVLPKIFEPLFTTKKNQGTGLGLAIAEQVVTRHGGHVFVESTLGHGTTFHLFLPATTAEPIDSPTASNVSSRGGRLLLVEDDPTVSAGLAAILEHEGFYVRTVATARAAFRAVEDELPDAVIFDIGLPDMAGTDAYRHIAATRPGLRVIFSSGHADAAQIDDLLEQKHVRFLRKPYDAQTLVGSLAEVITQTAEPPFTEQTARPSDAADVQVLRFRTAAECERTASRDLTPRARRYPWRAD